MRRLGLIIEEGVTIGENFDCGYYVILRKDVLIGNNVSIWSHSVIDPKSIIGDSVKIHCGVYISQGVVIESNVFIGPHTVLLNDKYPPRYDTIKWQPPFIQQGAVIGGNVTILPGVTIGQHAMIGGGSVLTRSVPENEVWVGNPARFLKYVSK